SGRERSSSFYTSISFGCGQGQKVSGVPRSVGGMGRSPGSRRAALCRERGGGRLCSCHTSLGRARGRGAGSQGVQSDGAAGLTCCSIEQDQMLESICSHLADALAGKLTGNPQRDYPDLLTNREAWNRITYFKY
uniref:Uncharacterized protein n=1 Tax=Aquila chrysaetos chrysaetos TaxID=223781 RepID=A0A663E356_AQUCH